MTQQSPKLSVRGLAKYFDGKKVLHDLDFDVNSGEFLSILGPSGCGKTTTLRILIGLLFQNDALFENMTVRGNVEYPLKFSKDKKGDRKTIAERALAQLGLSEQIDKPVHELSGGQQQRVSIARTLVTNPEIILFDEPMSALDVETRLSMREELKRIQRESGTTMIYITHDQEEAFALSDRIMVMGRGRIHQLDTPETIISSPADDYVNDFVNRNLRIKMDSLARFMGN